MNRQRKGFHMHQCPPPQAPLLLASWVELATFVTISEQCGSFITRVRVYIRGCPPWWTFCGFGQMVTCVSRRTLTQANFIVLKVLCASPVHPCLRIPVSHVCDLFTVSSFAFLRVSYSWNHEVSNLFKLASFTYNMHFSFLHVSL